jgi:hypothetical protein
MVYVLKQPVGTHCVDCNNGGTDWIYYQGATPDVCPQQLRVSTPFVTDGVLAVSFNGSSPTSNNCGNLGGYISAPNAFDFDLDVDVWLAYAQGAWTSSTTVSVYAVGPPAGSPMTISGAKNSFGGGSVSLGGIVPPTSASWLTDCPSVQVATITIMDDGSISIA